MGIEGPEVKVVKVSKVLPETRTTRRVVFLTSCDLVCRSYPYINRVFFYKATEEAAGNGGDQAEKVVRVLQEGLRKTLVSFYPLTGRFSVDEDARLQIDCCDAGVEFVEAFCHLPFSLLSNDGFQYRPLFWHLARRTHYLRSDYIHEPILSVQVTKFADGGGLSVGVSMSHTVGDAQSFYSFMRSWAETCRGMTMSVAPTHVRMALTIKALLPVMKDPRVQNGHLTKSKKDENCQIQEDKTHDDVLDPKLAEELSSHLMASKVHQNGNNFTVDKLMTELQQLGIVNKPASLNGKTASRAAPVMEKQLEEEEHRSPVSDLVQKIFSFSPVVLQRLKERANAGSTDIAGTGSYSESICKSAGEGIMGSLDEQQRSNGGVKEGMGNPPYRFTTFEAFCAHWWQSLIKARSLKPEQPVFLLIPINCRQRFLDIPIGYFGNALDGGLVKLTAGELCGAQIWDIAFKIHEGIKAATEESFRHYIKEAEIKRNAIPHFDRTGLFHVVDSPKYPVYETDFGFGAPEAVRAEGFRFGAEVQILAGRLGAGSYDMFCALDSASMRRLEDDANFLTCM